MGYELTLDIKEAQQASSIDMRCLVTLLTFATSYFKFLSMWFIQKIFLPHGEGW